MFDARTVFRRLLIQLHHHQQPTATSSVDGKQHRRFLPPPALQQVQVMGVSGTTTGGGAGNTPSSTGKSFSAGAGAHGPTTTTTGRARSKSLPEPPPILAVSPGSGPKLVPAERAEFVRRMRCLEYWQRCNDDIVEREFEQAKLLLMVNKLPAVSTESLALNEQTGRWEVRAPPKLAVFGVQELRQKLRPYGLEIGTLNSVLLDVWGPHESGENGGGDGAVAATAKGDRDYIALFGTSIRIVEMPEESGIPRDSNREELARALGVRFLDLRLLLSTMAIEEEADGGGRQREWLARFQSIYRWSLLFRNCPTCTHHLRMRASKSSAHCDNPSCEREFYPPMSPAVITLIHDELDQHILLARHRRHNEGGRSPGQLFTCIAGFCSPGETLEQTVRREVAEEVGLHCWHIRHLDGSQSWPIPDCSLMIPFEATAAREDKLEVCISELEHACWFNRDQVLEAVARVEDPLTWQRHLLSSSFKDPEQQRTLRYIPPKGTIAHRLIKNWALQRKVKL